MAYLGKVMHLSYVMWFRACACVIWDRNIAFNVALAWGSPAKIPQHEHDQEEVCDPWPEHWYSALYTTKGQGQGERDLHAQVLQMHAPMQ